MVFHKGQPKTKAIGRRQKKGETYRKYQAAALGPDVDVPDNGELDAAEPPRVKKSRVDGKWRTNRAIISRDKELVQLKSEFAASTVWLKSEVATSVAASVAASTVREYNTKEDAQKMIDNVTIKCNAKIRHKSKVAADVLENVKN